MSNAFLSYESRVTVRAGEEYFTLRASTLVKYLPRFIHTIEPWVAQDLRGDIVVDLGTVGEFRGRTSQKCLCHIFKHLKELETGASSALYDWLTRCYESSRRNPGSRRPDQDIARAFEVLGKLLHKHRFGCHKTIFDTLSTFFIMNIGGLARRYRSRDVLTCFIIPLDGMGMDMTRVIVAISSIFDLMLFVDNVALDSEICCGLRNDTSDLIYQMARNKRARPSITSRGSISRIGPPGRLPSRIQNTGPYSPDIGPLIPYPLGPRGKIMRGDFVPNLEDMIRRHPERFWYESISRRHGWSPSMRRPRILPSPLPSRDGSDLWDDETLSDFHDDFGFDYDSDSDSDSDFDVPYQLALSPFDHLGGFGGLHGDFLDEISNGYFPENDFGPLDTGHGRAPNLRFA
ncbi:MAG: hypothetical protein M1812_004062 [Candelaria pacifica]|nr:MAG: hypothetical protein M1812_004062 [Candelaria pacifica]